jgi:Zn-dependent peptidase ImmA (M78 family)
MSSQAQQITPAELRRIQREAKTAADAFLEQSWDNDRYPVDPFEIAKSRGFSSAIMNIPEDVSGILRKKRGEKPAIYIDAKDNWRRQRFTCAHELGHIALRQGSEGDDADDFGYVDRRSDLSSNGTDPAEVFANTFAANLLMPSSAVESLVDLGMPTRDLAMFFDVSIISMEYRLKALGRTP